MVSPLRLFAWLVRGKKVVIILALFILISVFSFRYLSNVYLRKTPDLHTKLKPSLVTKKIQAKFENGLNNDKVSKFLNSARNRMTTKKISGLSPTESIPSKKGKDSVGEKSSHSDTVTSSSPPCLNVHAFYYPWYGNPVVDKQYLHWNHRYLPHWKESIAKQYPQGSHIPPDDIGANFYPLLGPYSSSDPDVIKKHMQQLHEAQIGVIAVSYYPPGQADDNGKDWAHIFPMLLEEANNLNIKVTFHIEPYKDRNEESVKEDLVNIIDSYAMFPAFYKHKHKGKELPLIYIYDSYHTKPSAWARILKDGSESIRGSNYDAIVIGLVVEEKDMLGVLHAGFDGLYTYFAADGFTFGSTKNMWKRIATFSLQNDLLFIPSVGPGYIDTRVRPWNGENTRKRLKGKYYRNSWETALEQQPKIISITSFNEWHEGSQIEKVIPKVFGDFKYSDYSPHGSDYYLKLTKEFVQKFQRCDKYSKD